MVRGPPGKVADDRLLQWAICVDHWQELCGKMEATKTLYNLNADDMVRQRCQARMDAELQEQYLLKKIDTLTAENAAKDAEIESLKKELASLQQNV